jgi:hypothetical protein
MSSWPTLIDVQEDSAVDAIIESDADQKTLRLRFLLREDTLPQGIAYSPY